jgi:predicted nuclease with TOPRIM domain
LQAELRNLQRLYEQLTEQDRRLYEDFVDGKLKRETYLTKKAALRQRLEEVPVKVESVNQRISTLKSGYSGFVDSYSKYTELEKLTDEIAADLLDRVTIWPDGRLDISLNYLDEYSNIQMIPA